jgi:elongation factor Ts
VADFSAQDVAALRKLTGAGMMDCKKALTESGGDVEVAKDWLRKKGLAGAAKRAGRAADQGAVTVVVDGSVGAAVELTCETDFVAKGPDFQQALESLAKQVAQQGADDLAAQPFDGTTVGDAITQLGVRLGERIELGRVVRFETSGGLLDGYRHVQNERGTIAVLVELTGVDPADATAREVAHDIALHIASAAPRYVTRDQVTQADLDKEREVFTELTRNEGKPEAAIPKIVEGRMNGFYKDNVLVEQGFVKEPKTTIATLVEGLGPEAAVARFARVKVGED